jgi:hypothetical protein
LLLGTIHSAPVEESDKGEFAKYYSGKICKIIKDAHSESFFMNWYHHPAAPPIEHVNVVKELLAKNKTGEMQFLYLSPSQK